MAMVNFTINGKDALKTWGIYMGDGSLTALMTPPANKGYIVNESNLIDGKETLVYEPKVKDRDITLILYMVAPDLTTFLSNYEKFCAEMSLGVVDIMTRFQPNTVYHCTYSGCSQFQQYDGRFAKISLKLNEYNPADRAIKPNFNLLEGTANPNDLAFGRGANTTITTRESRYHDNGVEFACNNASHEATWELIAYPINPMRISRYGDYTLSFDFIADQPLSFCIYISTLGTPTLLTNSVYTEVFEDGVEHHCVAHLRGVANPDRSGDVYVLLNTEEGRGDWATIEIWNLKLEKGITATRWYISALEEGLA